ncbi:MAG: hypothetical protein JXB14_04860, partial [Candidatus Altiarchaeota archaeon]|nr:hypothetical protein [Candidatus Altiarchaeota archaeon]
MPGYLSLDRVDYANMNEETRMHLLRHLGRSMGYFHRRRAIHGDAHGGNILVRMDRLLREPEHPENIMYLDAETFKPLVRRPNPSTYLQDTQMLATHARLMGLVREPHDLHRHFYPNYMDVWRGSHIESEVAKIPPTELTREISTEKDWGDTEGKRLRAGLRERLYRRLGIFGEKDVD